ncbi:hypothetical protein SERLA73DRAFT_164788, partial [Serpula lacrymans var. lacrymans S7.3]
MSVATKNPFALLDEDDSPPAAPVASKDAPQPAPDAARDTQKSRGGPASRGGRYYARGGGSGNPSAGRERQGTAEEPTLGGEDAKRKPNGEGRGRGRGRGRGAPRGGRRPLDRHSATGKTDSEKKVHQSWGGDDGNSELKVEEAATNDAAVEATGLNDWAGGATDAVEDAWGAPPAAEGAAPAPAGAEQPEGRRREREPEEEDNTLTLDQYLAQKKEKDASAVPKLEVRKANEGAEDTIWDGVAPLKKGEEESVYFAGKTKSAPKTRTEKREKVYLEIDARFERPRGGRGGRGGERGTDGGRGGRGRGSGRGRAPGNAVAHVDVDDEKAFPSLA